MLQWLRAWLLTGNPLAEVWIPDLKTRDDREVVRMRLEVANKLTRCKCQIRCLLKLNNVDPSPMKPWRGDYDVWLNHQATKRLPRGAGVRKVLDQAVWSRLRTDEQARAKFERIAEKNSKRKKKAVVALMRELGTAMWHKALDALAA